jgi:tRNA threonylcarbamoyladenosine biosynthesis protein TsaE
MSEKRVVNSTSVEETENFAERLGKQLRGGEIIELVGDVGAGKTSFVRGLAKGAGSKDRVSSPTFTVNQIYKGRVTLYHYDFYRVHEDKLIESEIEEILDDQNSAIVLEWGQQASSVLSKEHIIISLSPIDDNSRQIKFTIPPKYSYISL